MVPCQWISYGQYRKFNISWLYRESLLFYSKRSKLNLIKSYINWHNPT